MVDGRTLVPNIAPGLGALLQAVGTPQQRAQRERQRRIEEMQIAQAEQRQGAINAMLSAIGNGITPTVDPQMVQRDPQPDVTGTVPQDQMPDAGRAPLTPVLEEPLMDADARQEFRQEARELARGEPAALGVAEEKATPDNIIPVGLAADTPVVDVQTAQRNGREMMTLPGVGSAPVLTSEQAVAQIKQMRPAMFNPKRKNRNDVLMQRLSIVAPQVAQSLMQVQQFQDARAAEAVRQQAAEGFKNATFIKNQGTHGEKLRAILSVSRNLASQGKPLDRMIELSQMSPDQLNLELERMTIAAKSVDALTKGVTGNFSKAAPLVVRKAGGQTVVATPITNNDTGETFISESPIEGEILSRQGESPEQQMARTVETAEQRAQATRQATAQEDRLQEDISNAITAADSMPVIRRALQLMNSVETGGFARAQLTAKRLFGVESADEGELAFNLGKNVLSQLRSTFGPAFTEAEGQRLQDLEANIGKSPAANRAILNQALKMAERAANRGIRSAERDGRFQEADDIREAMAFTLDPAAETPNNQGVDTNAGGQDEGAGRPYRNNSTDDILRRIEQLEREGAQGG